MSGFDSKWKAAAKKMCDKLDDKFIFWNIVEAYSDDHPGAPAPYPAKRDGILFARAWLIAEVTRIVLDEGITSNQLNKVKKQYSDAGFYEENFSIVFNLANEYLT